MDFNRVELGGRLTADPELRYVANGTAVTDLRIAVNREWTTESGEKMKDVCFVDVTFWKRQAEVACQYLRKGSGVFIEGSLKMDQWDDKNTGEKRSKLKVSGDRFHFLDKKSDGGGNDDGQRSHGRDDRRPQQQSRGGQPQGRSPAPSRGPSPQGREAPRVQGFDPVDDDDVPF